MADTTRNGASRPSKEAQSPLERTSSPACGGHEHQLLREADLADRWLVSVKTLQAARLTGNSVPFVKIGRAVRYRLKDVLAYEEARVRTSTSQSGPKRWGPA